MRPLNLREDVRKLDGRLHRRKALVTLLCAAALDRLLQVVRRNHAIRHRHARRQRDLAKRTRNRLADERRVRRRALYHGAQADNGLIGL